MPDERDSVVYMLMPRLPGGVDVLVDDRPGSLVIWVRDGLTPGEVMDRLTRGCSESVAARLWARSPGPVAAAPAA